MFRAGSIIYVTIGTRSPSRVTLNGFPYCPGTRLHWGGPAYKTCCRSTGCSMRDFRRTPSFTAGRSAPDIDIPALESAELEFRRYRFAYGVTEPR